MTNLEERVLRRLGPARVMLAGLMILVGGVSPLLLYIAFGPAKGNPIGLGLLAMVAVPAGLGMVLAGGVYGLVGLLMKGRS